MEKRFIGIDIDRDWVRLAIVTQTSDEPELRLVDKRPWSNREELHRALRELTEGTRIYGDRLAAALPASSGFSRWLNYPFKDPKKIEAAMGFSLAAQLPVADQDCVMVLHHRQEHDQGCQIGASAVPQAAVAAFLEAFDQENIPLQVLDLAPFAMPPALADRSETAVVALLRNEETVVALLQRGCTVDYRLASPLSTTAEQAEELIQQSRQLQAQHRLEQLPLYLLGPRTDEDLVETLRQQGYAVEIPLWTLGDEPVAAEFLPAVTLAWRALRSGRQGDGNFRRGPLALKGEWAALKKKLLLAGTALLTALALFVVAGWMGYAHKSRQARMLQQQLIAQFRETLPEAGAIVDMPLQLRQAIARLRTRGRLLGIDGSASALSVLLEVSARMPEQVRVDINTLNYGAEGLRLEGATDSYDDLNRIARSLEQSALFGEAQIGDARTAADNQRVEFRLNLPLTGEALP